MDSDTLKKLYNQANAINKSLQVIENDQTIDDSSWDAFNNLVSQAGDITSDDHLSSFTIKPDNGYGGGAFVRVRDYKRKVYSYLDYLHNQYLHSSTLRPDVPALTSGSTTAISQTQLSSQQIEVSVELNQTLISLTEILTTNTDKFESQSPERKFIDKFKSMLGTVKSVTEVISLLIRIAAEFGLSAEQLAKIFTK